MSMWRQLPAAALGALPAEKAHELTLRALSAGLGPRIAFEPPPELRATFLGLDLPSPVGVAAGFDKNAEAVDGLFALGAGFVEIGAVTPRPQGGNPRPRVFRLRADKAIINRLGFNNEGMDAAAQRLRARSGRPGVVGANLGANANSVDRMADYEAALTHLWGLAAFFTVNVSSPNTAGLRDLQERSALTELLSRLIAARGALSDETGLRPPLLVKISPDLDDDALAVVADVCAATGVDGAVVANTTLSRPDDLRSPAAKQAGGLSGAPLFELSTQVLRKFRRLTGGRLPLIGVGGVFTAAQAYEKIRAGASVVQLYTGLVYRGPGVFADIGRGLADFLRRDGYPSVAHAVGADVEASS